MDKITSSSVAIDPDHEPISSIFLNEMEHPRLACLEFWVFGPVDAGYYGLVLCIRQAAYHDTRLGPSQSVLWWVGSTPRERTAVAYC